LIQALRDRDHPSAERVLELHIRRTRVELANHPELFS
jgi:DNA-binding GntR family transcriptional regulator